MPIIGSESRSVNVLLLHSYLMVTRFKVQFGVFHIKNPFLLNHHVSKYTIGIEVVINFPLFLPQLLAIVLQSCLLSFGLM